MDIVKIGNRNSVHIVNTGTHFGAAQFIQTVDTQSVWNALLECWVLVYACQPDIFFMDHGSAFTSNEWKTSAEGNRVPLKFSGVQHHNRIEICEPYHDPLRRIYRKIEIECPDTDANKNSGKVHERHIRTRRSGAVYSCLRYHALLLACWSRWYSSQPGSTNAGYQSGT